MNIEEKNQMLDDIKFNINQILREDGMPSSFRVPLRKKISAEIEGHKD